MTTLPEMKKLERAAKLCLVTWATEPVSRTVSLKQLASILVDIRSTHVRNDAPDWAGRSFAYRAQVSKILDSAKLSAEDRKRVIGLLRYHVGNELRERLTEAELLAVDLDPSSPKERVIAAKGTYKTIDTAVKRLEEAVKSLMEASRDDISPDQAEALLSAAEELDAIGESVLGIA